MNAGIVGCGLIGQKRARALAGARLAACADIDAKRASQLASQHPGCVAMESWETLLQRPDIGLIIVATAHDSLAAITSAALRSGKHVLVEKPAALKSSELQPVLDEERRSGKHVRVGFNHRYHRAFRRAFELVRSGELGPLMFSGRATVTAADPATTANGGRGAKSPAAGSSSTRAFTWSISPAVSSGSSPTCRGTRGLFSGTWTWRTTGS